ncbi:MAG: peptidoglycan-binding protein [Sphaerospermopsis sp. SIO1G2]|nr:peptidoglycan-binding protein [Sphaerospermopsis sp. SIO1G1]NET72087.1 peptidoglycan-binding protein [Sphaerospermopsis sp. SIO1G2]
MEYMAYSYMYMANEETPVDVDLNLPNFDFQWQKLLKSSAWLALVGVSVFVTSFSQAQQASAEYVRTNGNCLNVRRGRSTRHSVVACVRNGAYIGRTGNVRYGFAQITSGRYRGHYVAERWISGQRYSSSHRRSRRRRSSRHYRVVIGPGSRGERVRSIQRALGIRVDGVYGPQTTRRVRNFQRRNNLFVDGIVGPATRRALGI